MAFIVADLLALSLAASEHDELTIPTKLLLAIVARQWSPSVRCISPLDTNACTAPESA